ncbi:MAG TPA: TetR/AcrR family transcriptional regulator [Steroidobacteraceae bacterium]|nr:TetR/AcrR family transcriptional regulator [Steroidobacteraceae bacterium]
MAARNNKKFALGAGRPSGSRGKPLGTQTAKNGVAEFSRGQALILDTAMNLFGAMGYTGTTMRDIAKEVGVLPGSLYAHIESKETLLVEIVDSGIRSFLNAVEPLALSNKSARARMRSAIKAHIAVVAQNPQKSLVVFHQWRFLSEVNLAAAVEKRRRYEKAFIRIAKDGVKSGEFSKDLDVRIAVLSILGALNWTPEWYSANGPATPDQLGETMADTLLNGLLAVERVSTI